MAGEHDQPLLVGVMNVQRDGGWAGAQGAGQFPAIGLFAGESGRSTL
jgi:hypothetical protein